MYCPRCGSEVAGQPERCGECGARLDADGTDPGGDRPPTPSGAPPPKPSGPPAPKPSDGRASQPSDASTRASAAERSAGPVDGRSPPVDGRPPANATTAADDRLGDVPTDERSGGPTTDEHRFPVTFWYPNPGFVGDLVEMGVLGLVLASVVALLNSLAGGATTSGALVVFGLLYAGHLAKRFYDTQWRVNPRRFETPAELRSFLDDEAPGVVDVPIAAVLVVVGLALTGVGWAGLLPAMRTFALAVAAESNTAGVRFAVLGFWFVVLATGTKSLASGCDRALVSALRAWQAARYR